MKAGKYTIKDLFVNRYVEQIIVPEIQRDYVWQEEQVIGLLTSIYKDYKSYSTHLEGNSLFPEGSTIDADTQQAFHEYYIKRKHSSNIGFIYAYSDAQSQGKYFLIDGQQRITTIYLTLLILASKEEDQAKLFHNQYAKKFTYKVREGAERFLQEFVHFILEKPGETDTVEHVKDQHWYYAHQYDGDATISSLIQNSLHIDAFISEHIRDTKSFFSYIQNLVEFWYFDTNLSQQGEELYIYMNARGEQVQAHENIKAEMLKDLSEDKKDEYGRKWEGWQDFFWQNKGDNENADLGFNEFLACIAGLENFLSADQAINYSKENFDNKKGIDNNDILKFITIEHVEAYFKTLKYLCEYEVFAVPYVKASLDSSWLEKATGDIWGILNKDNTNWFADITDANRATERNRMVFLWSVLAFVKLGLESTHFKFKDIDTPFRFIRKMYLRYHNFDRAVVSIPTIVGMASSHGIIDFRGTGVYVELWGKPEDERPTEPELTVSTKEDNQRSDCLSRHVADPVQLREIESLIWQIEDHPLNLNGRDVGGINISHLINLTPNTTAEDLKKVRDKFYELFPDSEKARPQVQNMLLHYGNYWNRIGPYYYNNYKFDSWRTIIRDRGNLLEKNETPFRDFFREWIEYTGSLSDFLREKKQSPKPPINSISLREKLRFYSHFLGNKMWQEGGAIAYAHGTWCALPDCEKMDEVFQDDFILYNTKGSLKGGNPKSLYEQLSAEAKEEIKTLKRTQHVVSN